MKLTGHHKTLKRLTTDAHSPASQRILNEIVKDHEQLLPAQLESAILSRYNQLTDNLESQQEVMVSLAGHSAKIGPLHQSSAVIKAIAKLYSHQLHNVLHEAVEHPYVIVQLVAEAELYGTVEVTSEQLVVKSARGSAIHHESSHFDVHRYDTQSLDSLTADHNKQPWQIVRHGKNFIHKNIGSLYQSEAKANPEQRQQIVQLAKSVYDRVRQPLRINWVIDSRNELWVTNIHLEDSANQHSPRPLIQARPGTPGWAVGQARHHKTANAQSEPKDILVIHSHRIPHDIAIENYAGIIFTSSQPEEESLTRLHRLGIPAVIGAHQAHQLLQEGLVVSIDGISGAVYAGKHTPKRTTEIPARSRIGIYGSVENGISPSSQRRPIDGIGLWSIDPHIMRLGTHPRHFIQNGLYRQLVDQLAADLSDVYRETGSLPLIMRTSQLSREAYQQLLHGDLYETTESDDLFGYRGGVRYQAEPDLFKAEIEAIRQAHQQHGNGTLQLALPYIRTIDELIAIQHLLQSTSLRQGDQVSSWLICQTPATAFTIEEFCKNNRINGVIIDVPMISKLMVGFDALQLNGQEHHLAHPAVRQLVTHVIKVCRAHDIPVLVSGGEIASQPAAAELVLQTGANGLLVPIGETDQAHELSLALDEQLRLNKLLDMLHA